MDKTRRIAALLPLLLALAGACALPGCASARQDSSAKEWDRAQCNQIIGERERKRCLERVEKE
ncbi:MAG TPA: hypothetical protein VFO24_06655 [Usitatibacter sp.]|nr:hypothetical protein [Usitatibacter sp.]